MALIARARKWHHYKRRVISALLATLTLAALVTAGTAGRAQAATLLSQGKPATASSTENAGTPASAAVDGNTGTRWSSAFSDPQWLQVDLGATATDQPGRPELGDRVRDRVPDPGLADAATWTTIYSTTTGTGGTQTLNVTGSGRYVRMYGTARATGYGYSPVGVPGLRHDRDRRRRRHLRHRERRAGPAGDRVLDGERRHPGQRRGRRQHRHPLVQRVHRPAVARRSTSARPSRSARSSLNWETAYATAFQIQVSTDNTTWTPIYSTTTGTGGIQTLTVSGTGRYIRMYGTARATGYGYSCGSSASTPAAAARRRRRRRARGGTAARPTPRSATRPPRPPSRTTTRGTRPSYAIDGSTVTRWSSAYADPQWLQVDLGASLPDLPGRAELGERLRRPPSRSRSPTTTRTGRRSTPPPPAPAGPQTLNVTGTGRYIRLYATARATGVRRLACGSSSVYTVGGVDRDHPAAAAQPAPGNCPWLNEPNVAGLHPGRAADGRR